MFAQNIDCVHVNDLPCVRSWFYQWSQWYTNIVQGSTDGAIGNTIGTNGTIGKDRW